MAQVRVSDFRIPTPSGFLFARQWVPEGSDASQRAPLVLLHDSLGCVALWRNFPEQLALAAARPVVAYDRLGFGASDARAGPMAADFVAHEVHEGFTHVVQHLGIERFALLGHSVGGGMAASIAAALPHHCVALITESAQSFIEERTLQGIREADAAFAAPEQMVRLAKYHGDKAEWVLRAWVDTWLLPERASWTLDDSLRRVQCPVLAIHGESDEYGSLAHPARIERLVHGPVQVLPVPGCGHVPHRELPEVVLKAVAGFLDHLHDVPDDVEPA